MMHCVARKQFKVKNSQMFNIPQTRLSCRKNSIFSTQSEVFEKCWKLEYTLIFNYFYFSCYMLSTKTFLKATAELEMKLNVSKYFCYCRLTEGTMLQGVKRLFHHWKGHGFNIFDRCFQQQQQPFLLPKCPLPRHRISTC